VIEGQGGIRVRRRRRSSWDLHQKWESSTGQ
jgi:hypothetical protein